MTEHLPPLQVVLPVLAAPACLLVRNERIARLVGLLVCLASFAIAALLLERVLADGPLSYALGGWEPPFGIEYRVDTLNAFVLVAVTAIAAVVLMIGTGGQHGIAPGRESLFYAAYLLAMAGLLGIAITGDAFNAFVFLEISSLASYTLISLGAQRRAVMAAFSYLVMGTIGGTFFLIGVGLLYQVTGTLNMADLAARLPPVEAQRTVLVAFAFLTVGISIKLAVFPLHQWLPNAYSYAPAAVSAFLAGTATKVMFYLLVRVIFSVFGAAWVFGTIQLDWLLLPLSLAAMFVGALAAIWQRDLRRLLAYSSISQLGYMTLGLSLASEAGLTGGLVHIFNHGTIKAGLFLVVACIGARIGTTRIDGLAGLGRRMPLTTAAFVVGGLGLIGVPSTAGFVSKWYFVTGALQSDAPWIAFAVLLSSLLAVVYVWRVVEVAYFRSPPAGAAEGLSGEAPAGLLVPAWILIGVSMFFGIDPRLPLRVAASAARALLGAGG
jgi:multicomponent Na+:H+ antiporter subunit D